ncbi:MAG: serine metalloprotease [Legionella sp.]|nr:MAG: serine metalloprotease [Legionella sp.]
MRLKLGILSLGLWSVIQGVYAAPDANTVRVIIKYKQSAFTLNTLKTQITQSTHLPIKAMKPMANGAFSLILDTQKASFAKNTDASEEVIAQLRKNPNVLYAVKDRVGYIKPVLGPVMPDPVDELSHANQWNQFKRPGGILLESEPGKKDGAWLYTTGESKKEKDQVVVAVLDTGITLNEGIVNSLVKDEEGQPFGWSFAENNDQIIDDTESYHGTHVSGIIAGYGEVMSGVGPDLKVLTVKISNAEGMFYESAVINGIYWTVGKEVPGAPVNKHPAKVLNMSFGVDEKPGKEIDYCDEALQEAITFARKKGAVIAAAAGNDNVWEHYSAPAICNGTMRIASTGPEGLRAYYSNYGPAITFAAPGGDQRYGISGAILSTVNPEGGYHNSGYDFYQGTSMAAPHVAGVAGLLYAVAPKLKPEKVEQILYTTTHDFGKSTNDDKSCEGPKPCGHGILDAKAAVKAVVEDYNLLFSAPKLTELGVETCGKGLLQGSKQIQSGDSVWVQTQASCEKESVYQHPHIEQAKDGTIYAHYGNATYQLEQSAFTACKVIGFDGVGCK